jgi:hypothetical protein
MSEVVSPITVEDPDDDDDEVVFHRALHVLLNQLVDDDNSGSMMDYPGVLRVLVTMFEVAPKDGIAHDVINNHLDEIMETLFFTDDIDEA